jgi:hypothetical protein
MEISRLLAAEKYGPLWPSAMISRARFDSLRSSDIHHKKAPSRAAPSPLEDFQNLLRQRRFEAPAGLRGSAVSDRDGI